jgi:apolipoprotein N-acyltransferase
LKIAPALLKMECMKKKDLLSSLLSGVLLILSFPNLDLEFLAWFALVPLLYAIDGKELYRSFTLGFLTGLTAFLGILYWVIVAVHTYGNVPLLLSVPILLLLVAYLSVYIGAFAFLTRFIQKRTGLQTFLFMPALWVSLEYLRSFLLSGFPWANLGHSQYLNLPFIQIADMTGVYGLSFIILLVNVTLYSVLRQWQKRTVPSREIAFASILLLGILIYGYAKLKAVDQQIPRQPPLRVGLVQGNIDQSVKWDKSFQLETLKIYHRLSLRVAEQQPDLIIWPETATPFFFQNAAEEYHSLVLDVPRKTNTFLLFGSPSYKIEKGRANHYNSAYLLTPSGEVAGKYDKIHLVPFGEYVPLGEILKLGSLGEGIGNFESGREIANLSIPQGKFGVLICFEIIFPDLCRRFVKKGANFLVTITNDAWFGRTSAPYQHFSMAVFRAVENRVFVARAANTGISGLIDPSGKILKQGKIFAEEAITGTIRLSTERTFYTLYGDVFAWLCSGFTLLLLASAFSRRK